MPDIDIDAIKISIDSDSKVIDSPDKLEEFRMKYLGRKGIIAELTGSIPSLPRGERAVFGQKINALKNQLSSLIAEKEALFFSQEKISSIQHCPDISMPGIAHKRGHIHPVAKVTEEICEIFRRMGFSVIEGPEVETEFNNFTGLNIPLEHASRDAFDTFYLKTDKLKDRLLLRSHTSPVQIRVMKRQKPPLAVVVPGRVYRPDATDASHLFMFHQIEGFMVDSNIKFSDLKGILNLFVKKVFGKNIRMRFRPHFFPFTEPSAEVDIACAICNAKGCSSCGHKGWLEILGAGMIHPNVFRNVGYDPEEYTGFAFGMGIERIAMLKYGINDIRIFYNNDLRFLEQF